jgi:hypothetical protein
MKFLIFIIGFTSFYLNATTINITYLDEAGTGFYSTEPYAPTSENPSTTLGEARRYVLERTVKMFSTQFYNPTPIFWGVSLEDLGGGFGAITLGPTFTEFTQGSPVDEFGILTEGTHYPSLLIDALTNNVNRTMYSEDDYDATTQFSSYGKDYGFSGSDEGFRFASVVLHELVHVIGFATTDCLRGCIPQSTSNKSHYNQYVFVEDSYNKFWEELTLLEKEEAAMLESILFFKGSDATLSFAKNQLNSGTSNNGIGLHSGVNSDGSWDGQSIGHLSPKITPAQLMLSAGSDVNELGAAAYILCDTGWCRNNGFVADLSVTSINDATVKPNIMTTISFEVANLGSNTIEDIYLEFEITDGVEVIESSSTDGCKVTEKTAVCEITELFSEQYINIDIAITATEGEHIIDSKLYSKSFIVDPKGANNLNILTINSEESPFPIISLEENYSFTSGDSVTITPKHTEKPDDELSFNWVIISGDELIFDQNLNTGVLSFTAPEVTTSTTTNLKLTIQSKGRIVEKSITLSISPKSIKPEVKLEDSSSGGGMINLLSLFSMLLLIMFKKKKSH